MRLKSFLARAATLAAFCATAAVALPSSADAASATVYGSLNVRSGPGTNYPVIDRLSTGDTVDIGGCRSGWCYLTDREGFVSSSYLRTGGATVQPNFNLSFRFPQGSFTIGSGGVSVGVGTPRPPRPTDDRGVACFYSGANYTGDRFCLGRGEQRAYVGRAWNNRISSIRNRSGLRVTVCNDAGFDICRTYTTSAAYLGSFNNVISSVRVR